jgi:hypothetical protein
MGFTFENLYKKPVVGLGPIPGQRPFLGRAIFEKYFIDLIFFLNLKLFAPPPAPLYILKAIGKHVFS